MYRITYMVKYYYKVETYSNLNNYLCREFGTVVLMQCSAEGGQLLKYNRPVVWGIAPSFFFFFLILFA